MNSSEDLIADFLQAELPDHLRTALVNGPTRDELADILAHLALFARPLPGGCVKAPNQNNTGDDYAKANLG
ncbi:MAG: hypothetical protein QM754_05405 [Tepidisphaeraceae bacterium]